MLVCLGSNIWHSMLPCWVSTITSLGLSIYVLYRLSIVCSVSNCGSPCWTPGITLPPYYIVILWWPFKSCHLTKTTTPFPSGVPEGVSAWGLLWYTHCAPPQAWLWNGAQGRCTHHINEAYKAKVNKMTQDNNLSTWDVDCYLFILQSDLYMFLFAELPLSQAQLAKAAHWKKGSGFRPRTKSNHMTQFTLYITCCQHYTL